jgi:RHS repeat-associated protein
VGTEGLPGSAVWRPALGRNWSHEYAERIVIDPDVGTDATVWLLTRWGTFRQFSGLASGTYTSVAPSDEYRTLRRTGSGWELEDLSGTISVFDSNGVWQSTTDRNGNAYEAVYTGSLLTSVAFPDGRSEIFAYTSGRLATITQMGRGTSPPTRTWTLTWSGDDLVRILRPDGTAWRFEYEDTLNPGYITRMYLVPTTGAERVEGAWEYDIWGNVTQTWKGAANFTEAGAVDKWELSYDSPEDPTQTSITDPLGVVSTRTYERDPVSRKPRVTSISGSCSACGASPETTWAYDDSSHPLLPTTVTDGMGTQTVLTYGAHGRVASKTEGANVGSHPYLPRFTEWEYDADYPAFATRIEGPTGASEPVTRIMTMSHDSATGNLEGRTIEGGEATYPTGSFALAIAFEYNAAGRPEAIDPPGYGAADRTTYTYGVPDANGLLPDTRTDPLLGTWEFEYDAYNRRVRAKNPNGAVTDAQYDALDRQTLQIQREDDSSAPGDAPVGTDLATRSFYTPHGDLFCVKSPAGAGTQFDHDSAGRSIQQIRGTAVANPSSTTCLMTIQLRERAIYTLDGAGHRIFEKLQRTTTSTFPDPVTTFDRSTAWEYSTMCHLDKKIEAPGESEEAVTDYAFDCRGNLEAVWDASHPRSSYPSQPSTAYAYDVLNRLESATQPWGGSGGGTATTGYEYDVQDHLVEVTDGEGTVTTYVYSDRDRMTSQVSEVSGTTTYGYNEHGELLEETDARAVTVLRTVDEADRLAFVDYPGNDLDVTYEWGTSAQDCEIGRLVGVTRNSETIGAAYDCFGRRLQDGELSYTYSADGDRLTMSYPGSLMATYTYDRMRRPVSLSIQEGGGSPLGLVLSNPGATYKPFGPLVSLRFDLTTDRNEVRGYDQRYAPTSIRLQATSGSPPAELFGWDYTTNEVGNIEVITQTAPAAVSRTYSYQDWQYYLTEADGPWGFRDWGYDRVGNRLDEGGVPYYVYAENAATTGNTSELSYRYFGFIGSDEYGFDSAGYQTQFTSWRAGQKEAQNNFVFNAAGELSLFDSERSKDISLRYDARGFLSAAFVGAQDLVEATYSSEGILHSHLKTLPSQLAERTNVIYFAGRPIAIWKKVGSGTATLARLVTDHLGTPAASIQQAGTVVDWFGGFEPFGGDWQAGTAQDSLAKGIFLRMPGQWKDAVWSAATYPQEIFYNVHRWYEPQTGRYTSVDPLHSIPILQIETPRSLDPELFSPLYGYAAANPVSYIDPLGLLQYKGCSDEQRSALGGAFDDYCKRAKDDAFKDCMCDKSSIPSGLSRLCGDPALTVRCKPDSGGSCSGNCAWSVPFGRTIRICPGAWNGGTCGPLGCTFMHEMTHQLGHGREKYPQQVEQCLGCP